MNYDDSRDIKVFVRFPANSILKFLLKFWYNVGDTHILPTWKRYRLILQVYLKMTFRSKVVAELLGQINFNFFAPIFHMQSVLEIFGGKWIYQYIDCKISDWVNSEQKFWSKRTYLSMFLLFVISSLHWFYCKTYRFLKIKECEIKKFELYFEIGKFWQK